MKPSIIKRITRKTRKMALLTVIAIVCTIVVSIFLMFVMYRDVFQYPSEWKHKIYRPFSEGMRPSAINLEIYNLSSPIHQQIPFDCVSTKTDPVIRVCLYPIEMDGYISHDIKTTGIWEPDITNLLVEALESDESSVFLDIGSNVGYFSLLAARMGHFAVAVEPDLDHVLRFHRSIELEKLHDKIVILRNAVADEREVGTVRKSGHNQGDSQIEMEVKECIGHCPPTVKVIVLNDLTDIIYDATLFSTNGEGEANPASNRNLLDFIHFKEKHFRGINPLEMLKFYKQPPANVIVKVDTQGFEHKIFDNPDFFFDRNSVSLIFMEWGPMARSHPLFNRTGELPSDKTFAGQKDLGPRDAKKVEIMIRFLSERAFRPYSSTRPRLGEALNPFAWDLWPHDVVWCHDSETLFMAKLGLKNLIGR